MTKYWIRRGVGAFVRVKNAAKGRARAKHWHRTGQGDGGAQHPVIGLFKNGHSEAHRTELYG